MNPFRIVVAVTLALATSATCVLAQGGGSFDLSAYEAFLRDHAELSASGLAEVYPPGTFAPRATHVPTQASFFRNVDSIYRLTATETGLLATHGFMVSERLQRKTFAGSYLEIYHADLPVFISADAILHAFHMSYDAILQDVEHSVLIPTVDELLAGLAGKVPELAKTYAGVPGMAEPLQDMDLYLTVARRLLGRSVQPYFLVNASRVTSIEAAIAKEAPATIALFGDTPRDVDFSQFTVRGHYVLEPEFQAYFRAMIWLGRTEFYMQSPPGGLIAQSPPDIQRQIIAAVLLAQAVEDPAVRPLMDRMESTLRVFVGDQDNITPALMMSYIAESGVSSPVALTDSATLAGFQRGLLDRSYAAQRINSQILWSGSMDPGKVLPAASFLLLGQRFIVDSYVTSKVVFNQIDYHGIAVKRMLPSSLDVLFALGNDAAARLLGPELETYHYASNLAALRYLIDGYEPAFWDSTLYNCWLQAIRSLSPPRDRDALPPFMRTAAWWQKGMNTQLAAWAQLRHDNLLYAKQSYSGGVICSYPDSYVEPVPGFFGAMKTLAALGARIFSTGALASGAPRARAYFSAMTAVMDTLHAIAEKQRIGTARTDQERAFLRRMINMNGAGCVPAPDGWYPNLYYNGQETLEDEDLVVADVHTAPTDSTGAIVGWVKHAGTGPVNLGVVIAPCSDGTPTAYVGAMASYYEHTTLHFKRLTDDEWKTQLLAGAFQRPSWVNLYLADSKGGSRGDGPTLLTGVATPGPEPVQAAGYVLAQNYPNPFNPSTLIAFAVPPGAGNATVTITIYDVRGARVRELLHMPLAPGSYSVRWDGTSDRGEMLASGAFFYALRAGEFATTRSMLLLR